VKKQGVKKEIGTKSDVLGFFYRYPIKTIPVVNMNKKKILGILLKDTLTARASTISELSTPMKQVIKEHLIPVDTKKDYHALQNLLQNFKRVETIPVLNLQGKLVDNWNKSDLICIWEEYPKICELEWKRLFDKSPYPVIITDKDNCIEYFNPVFSDKVITGRGRKIYGRNIQEIIPNVPEVTEKPVTGKLVVLCEEEFICDVIPMGATNERSGSLYIMRPVE
jgi:PAS domain-containing protein